MPRFHFHVHDGRSSPDREGTELPDARAARVAAIELAGQILRDEARTIAQAPGHEDWRVEVTDAAGRAVFRLDLVVTDAPATRACPIGSDTGVPSSPV